MYHGVKYAVPPNVQESLEALQRLSEVLDCSMSCFATSGIKDKRAVTTQLVTVRGITADRYTACASLAVALSNSDMICDHMTVT